MKKKAKSSKLARPLVRWIRLVESIITAFTMMFVGSVYCVMTHLPDAVGVPLLTIGFFTMIAAMFQIQEEVNILSRKSESGPPVYRTETGRRKNENGHENGHLLRYGRSAGKVGSRRVA